MRKILLSSLVCASIFAYTDYDTFGDRVKTNVNANNVAFKYYRTGIDDASLVFQDEIKKASLYDSEFPDLINKYVVLININDKSINEVIFFRAVALKTNILDSFVVRNGKDKYVLFGAYDNEIDANFALEKVKSFNIPAEKTYLNNATFHYDKLILNHIDKNLNYHKKLVPLKLVVIKTREFIDGKVVETIVEEKPATPQKVQKAKAQKKPLTKEEKELISKKHCLADTIYMIRSYGLFNNKTLQFKFNNRIYSKGDVFTNEKSKCSFTITDVFTKSKTNLVIQFDDFADSKLIARLQTLQDGFVPLSSLFYNFEEDIKNDKTVEEQAQVVAKVTQTTEESINKNLSDMSKQTQQKESNQPNTIEQPLVQEITNVDKTEENKASVGNKKICNFDPIVGIRTQLVLEGDKYVKKPVLKYYQGKQVEINAHIKNDNVLITTPNAAEMLISKKDFEKNCQ